jgi:hypothetical protein
MHNRVSNPELTSYLSRYQGTRDIWCQKWSDLTELSDLRLCLVTE